MLGNNKSFSEKLREGLALIFGWRSTPNPLSDSNLQVMPAETPDLSIFLQNLHKAYSNNEEHKYLALDLLKHKLSSTYSSVEFDELLISARQKYPTKIWIDKNAQGKTIIKIVP